MVMDAETGESFISTPDKVLQATTVYEYTETYGKNKAARQLITRWKDAWKLSPAQVRGLLTLINDMPASA